MSKVGLLDCNNFFVSCERLFRPDLQNVPVAVLSSNDGCVVARSQEVKDFGIAMGVPYFQVKDICDKEKIVLFSGNLTLYRDISARVMEVLADEVGHAEVYSIDEAFFKMPEDTTVEDIQKIRDRVMRDVGVPVSVGVASTKTLAKHASSIGKKQDGAFLLTDEDWHHRAQSVPCGAVWGLGAQTTTKLSTMGIKTVSEFLSLSISDIRRHFGVSAERVYQELKGKSIFVVGDSKQAKQKSIMSTGSFSKTTTDIADLESAVAKHVVSIAKKLRDKKMLCTAMNVQIQTDRFGDFFMQGDSVEVILSEPSADTQLLLSRALDQVRNMYKEGIPYKKAGVSVSKIIPEAYRTQTLFSKQEDVEKDVKLDSVTDAINDRFGGAVIQTASILKNGVQGKSSLRSPSYTTSWEDIPSVYAI
jgi:DNA polymerase V